MAYRGDGEPEYIGDDEFFDPDEFSASSRSDSNVLGGSGSRHARESFHEPPAKRAHDEHGNRDPQAGPGRRDRKAAKAGRKSVKARNPAPSMADSEERRARLAGKHQRKTRRSDSQKRAETGVKEADADKHRFGGLRGRFSRGGKPQRSNSERTSGAKLSRIASAAGGFGGRIGALRGRLRRNDANDASSNNRRGKTESPASKAARTANGARFGASRGTTRSREGKRGESLSAAQAGKVSNANRARASKAPKIASDGWLDLDRKLDLIGVGLVFGAIVFVFSALSPEQAAIGGVHRIVGQLLGWGAIAVPLAMFAVGLWLIIRHFGDEPPIIDPVRLSGVSLTFLSLLVLFQYIDSLGYPERCGRDCIGQILQQSYQSGRGGGLIGSWVYSALVINLTELGGFVVVVMTLTIAAMLTTRASMVELAAVVISLSRNMRTRIGQVAVQRRAARLKARQQQLAMAKETNHVRIRKPEPAQLSASPQTGAALPEPSSDWMPIPNRLRTFLGPRTKSELELNAESLAIDRAAQLRGKGRVRRFLSRRRAEDEPVKAAVKAETGHTGRLERFLNLGDDLRPASARRPAADLPAPPPRVNPAGPPPTIKTDRSQSLTEPAESRPEPPPAFAPEPRRKNSKRTSPQPAAKPAPAAVRPTSPFGQTVSADDEALHDTVHTPGDVPKPRVDSKPSNTSQDKRFVGLPASASEKPGGRIEWDMPDYRDLLNAGTASEFDREALLQQAQIIEETLASFGAPGRVVEVNSGPVITQYGVEPAYITAKTGKRNRVKVGAIAKLDKDLQLALGARSLRMEAPVPGKGYVGIEVPNPASARVGLCDVMDSGIYQKIDSPLAIALGMSVDGKPIAADLTQMPHLLIAGTTGSGKSICINAIINSLLVNNSPETVRFIMVDPKRVELTGYNGLPHLVAPVVVELERILGVLRWVTSEMDERYKKFSQAGARNIIDYNSILDPDLAAMPYIVVVIDELADLMMMAPDDTERAIARIAALARATGIHLVIATQRPSVDVVTGLIKANCPARIAFAVASSVDSRVIIDQPGAERLLGKGDMLYLSGDAPAPQRVQGAHVSNEEIQRIGRFWKLQKSGIAGVEPIPLPPKSSPAQTPAAARSGSASKRAESGQAAFWDMTATTGKEDSAANGLPEQAEDELYQTAVDLVRRLDKASVSLLQRRLRIGYTRAARLVDMMEERGVVGPPKEGSSKPRDVLKQ